MSEDKDEYWWVEHKAPAPEPEITPLGEMPTLPPLSLDKIQELLEKQKEEAEQGKTISLTVQELSVVIQTSVSLAVEKERNRQEKMFKEIIKESTSGSALINKDNDNNNIYVVYPSRRLGDNLVRITLVQDDKLVPIEIEEVRPKKEIKIGFYQDEKGKLFQYSQNGWIGEQPTKEAEELEYLG